MPLWLCHWLAPRTSRVPFCWCRQRPPRFGRLRVEELECRLLPSGNLPVTTDPGVQQNPSLAADPLNPRHLVVAYLDYSQLTTGYAGIGVAVSLDAGASWQHTSLPLPAGFNQGAASPVVQFDAQGHVFVSFQATTFLAGLPALTDPGGGGPRALGFQSDNGIFVARSDDGGSTWNPPVAVVSHLDDGTDPVSFEIKPDLAVDPFPNLPDGQPNPNYGNLYEVWSRYYPPGQFPDEPTATGGSQILLAVSHDAGQTWQIEPQPVAVATDTLSSNTGIGLAPGTGFENWSQVAVGPQGDIYVVQGTSAVTVYHSTDGGASFSQPDVETGALYPFGSLLNEIPSLTLSHDQFRTQTIHDIAADPTRPGYVYVVSTIQITDQDGNTIDPGDVLFARSTDYGLTWQTTFQLGPHAGASVLNDDNGGQSATGDPGDVIDGQTMPRLAVDAQGDVGVVWYDTRRDPAQTLLDVFGTVSSDGGQTFSSNFRITDQSFNPNLGPFQDATGQTNYYLGDAIGLTLAGGTACAAWTDTRHGNQDVYTSSFPINPPPPPLSNRFAPNSTADTATDLGRVLTRDLPQLTIAAGDEEWFQLQAAAEGNLTATATLAVPGDSLRLELYDSSGTTLLASGSPLLNAAGQVIGQRLTCSGPSGQTYLVRVLPGPEATADTPVEYTLDLQSLTHDLMTQVYGTEPGTLTAGQDIYYALTVPATGSLQMSLTPGADAQGRFHLELLDQGTLAVLASGQTVGTIQQAGLAVTQGQGVYVHVFGDAGAQGKFSLEFSNLDQFTTPGNHALFFPTEGNPSQVLAADLNHDGKPDLVVDYAGQNFVSVLLNNGDGTFQAPRDFAVGAFQAGNSSTLGGLPDVKREMVIADFTSDGIPDVAVLNYQSDDVSLLVGRGDGTFAPQQIIGIGSLASPFALTAGDLNQDGETDLVIVGSRAGPTQQGEVLLGRGNGTFGPPLPFTIPFDPGFPTSSVQMADLNHDGKPDLVYEGLANTYVLLGNGDGTFGTPTPTGLGSQGGLVITDLNGDGHLDILTTAPESFTSGDVEYALGNGDGTFQAPVHLTTGQAPLAVAVADLGSQISQPDGSTILGPPDGIPDLIVANNGIVGNFSNGPPNVVLVPGLADAQGHFTGFGSPVSLAAASSPLDLRLADLTGNGSTDIVFAEVGGIEVIYGQPLTLPPNTTPQTARNLGTVVHLVQPTQTIVPGHPDAYYSLTVPTEAAAGAGDEVLDFSGSFQATSGAGLAMQVTDAAGTILGSGERFRLVASPGAVLTLHVFGVPDSIGRGASGAYTLDIDVLPQVLSVQAEALLPGAGSAPGGPTTSLVITLQGDRLDPATAQDPANYTISFLGPNGPQVIPLASGQSAVYDPSSNVDVATGLSYPTAVRQTVTLLFDQPLPTGSYQITLASAIQAASFNIGEQTLLSNAAGLAGHPLVSVGNGAITPGDTRTVASLVPDSTALGDLAIWQIGTPFLTQLHDDLNALLDAKLTALGNARSITTLIDNQIIARIDPALGAAGSRPIGVLVIWLDPVPFALADRTGQRAVYSLPERSFQNSFTQASISVAGNVEVLVLPFVVTSAQSYLLTVANVSATARGGAILFGRDAAAEVTQLTAPLRAGVNAFLFAIGGQPGPRAAQVAANLNSVAAPPNPADPSDSTLSSPWLLINIIAARPASQPMTVIAPRINPSSSGVRASPNTEAAALRPGPRTPEGSGDTRTAPPPEQPVLVALRQLVSGVGKWLGNLVQLFLGMFGIAASTSTPEPVSQSEAASPLQAVSCLMVGCGLMTAFSGQEAGERKRANQGRRERTRD